MASLIEDVLSIENQANEIVSKAQEEARSIEKSAEAEIDRIRAEIDDEVDGRIAAYRRDAEQKQSEALEKEKAEAATRLSELDRLDQALMEKLSGMVVKEFRGR